jgi:hypothetical protein
MSSSCFLCTGSRVLDAICRHSVACCWYSETLRNWPPQNCPNTQNVNYDTKFRELGQKVRNWDSTRDR